MASHAPSASIGRLQEEPQRLGADRIAAGRVGRPRSARSERALAQVPPARGGPCRSCRGCLSSRPRAGGSRRTSPRGLAQACASAVGACARRWLSRVRTKSTTPPPTASRPSDQWKRKITARKTGVHGMSKKAKGAGLASARCAASRSRTPASPRSLHGGLRHPPVQDRMEPRSDARQHAAAGVVEQAHEQEQRRHQPEQRRQRLLRAAGEHPVVDLQHEQRAGSISRLTNTLKNAADMNEARQASRATFKAVPLSASPCFFLRSSRF